MNAQSPSRFPSATFWTGRPAQALLLALLCLTLGAKPPAALTQQIDQIMEGPASSATTWGIYIKDLHTGEVLYNRNGEKAFMPASNQKLLTTAAALDALGADFRYQTKLHFIGKVRGSVLDGDLVIQGSGDPTLGSIEMGGQDPLRQWAQALKQIGVTQIQGRIIGDDDVFDDRPYAEGWDIDYITNQSSRSLGVSAGGLSYRDNVIDVQFTSGPVGSPPEVRTTIADYLRIRNLATTSSRRRGWALNIQRGFDDVITLTGSLPRSYQSTISMPVANPTTYALHSFQQYLRQAGIEVDGELVDIDDLPEPPDYDKAQLLFVHFSPPLAQIISVLNKESNNFYAEQVFRTMAYGGSAAGGERRVKALLARAGVSDPSISIRDGSGLSRKDLITPRAMVELLHYMATHPQREPFISSLAQGGEVRSTLRGRLGGMPVQAKTGSLEFVRTLSGYTIGANGHPIAFAVFANHFTGPSYQITQTIDQIVRTVTKGAST